MRVTFEFAAIVVLKAEKLWWIYVLGRLRLYSNIAHEILKHYLFISINQFNKFVAYFCRLNRTYDQFMRQFT